MNLKKEDTKTEINDEHIPWVEKYRPKQLSNIILDKNNEMILENILKQKIFPNMLLYGSPGTGKTTTIINITRMYLMKYYKYNKESIIHLNASDERGIDIIRNQLQYFVSSNSMNKNDYKFVILDEIDYMTRSAQIALKILIEEYKTNVTFCLICNYISKIEIALRNMFVVLRFNNLPKSKMESLLEKINTKENINFSKRKIKSIVQYYKSDIRSMVNYIQTYNTTQIKIIDNEIYDQLLLDILKYDDINKFLKRLFVICKRTENTESDIIIYFCKYLLEYSIQKMNDKKFEENEMMKIFEMVQYIVESTHVKLIYKIKYLFYGIKKYIK